MLRGDVFNLLLHEKKETKKERKKEGKMEKIKEGW